MLVLSVKADGFVDIDGGIRVWVSEIRGAAVRLGFDAPKEIGIRREGIQGGEADRMPRPVIEAIRARLGRLSAEERKSILSQILAGYCVQCGSQSVECNCERAVG